MSSAKNAKGHFVALAVALVVVLGASAFYLAMNHDIDSKRPQVAAKTPVEVRSEEGWEIIRQKHVEGRVLDDGLPILSTESELLEASEQDAKDRILKAARHDPDVLRYYLEVFGFPTERIPSEEELVSNLEVRKESWYQLEGIVTSLDMKPTILTGTWANDGMTPEGQLTSQQTAYGGSGTPAWEVTEKDGDKSYLKEICGQAQRKKAPPGAVIIPPKAPRNSSPETTPHHPGNPSTQPPSANTEKAVPTPGVIPGVPEEVKESQDANANNPAPVSGGKTGEQDGSTTDPDGKVTPSPQPTTPPDTTDDGYNEGDPGMPD